MKLSALVAAFSVCLSLPTILGAQEDPGFSAPSQQSSQLQPVQMIPETIDKIELKDNLKEYPIWLVIKPEGVRFLQTEEEIALHRNQIPQDAFLVSCQQATFEASSEAEKRAFDLKCEEFVLMGSYGTKQHVEAKGAALSYSTTNDQLQLSGEEKQPVEARLNGQESTTLLSAEQIRINLHKSPIKTTKYVPVRKGQYQAVIEESDLPLTHFQLSAEKIVSLEIHPAPAPQKNTKPRCRIRNRYVVPQMCRFLTPQVPLLTKKEIHCPPIEVLLKTTRRGSISPSPETGPLAMIPAGGTGPAESKLDPPSRPTLCVGMSGAEC